MRELRSRNDNIVGFVDPYVIFKDPNPTATLMNDMCMNLMRFLVNQQEKRTILFLYNFK